MSLLDAPAYNERKEKLIKNALIGSASLVFALVLLTFAGYLLGHGWLFTNLPAEHKVKTFFQAIQDKDYDKAFAIYNNDPDWKQHPDKYKDYPEARFQDDWSTQDPIDGPLKSFHVDISKTDGSWEDGGTIVAVRVNGDKKVFMQVIRKSGALVWPAFHEIQY